MSQELFYTSAPKGLQPGSRGFCTVATTRGLQAALLEKLEALSGYRPVFAPHDAQAVLNPVAWAHQRLPVAGRSLSVLSRVCSAGLDYTQRTNKFAHHVVLDGHELPVAGPAWLLSQPGFMATAWDGEVRLLDAGRAPPRGEGTPGPCRAWQRLTGDAGWAGAVAEAYRSDPNRLVYVVFEPGMDLLPLFAEALSLLPARLRWQVSFNTYFTGVTQGLACTWRGVLKDSAEAKERGRTPGVLVIELGTSLGPAKGGILVECARTGQAPPADAVADNGENSPTERVASKDDGSWMRRSPAALEAVRREMQAEPIAAGLGSVSAPSPARAVPAPVPVAAAEMTFNQDEPRRSPRTGNWLAGFGVGTSVGIFLTLGLATLFWHVGAIKLANQEKQDKPSETTKSQSEELEKLKGELARKQGQLTDLTAQLNVKVAELDKLRSGTKNPTVEPGKLEALLKEITDKTAELDRIKGEVTSEEKKLKDLKRQIGEKEAKVKRVDLEFMARDRVDEQLRLPTEISSGLTSDDSASTLDHKLGTGRNYSLRLRGLPLRVAPGAQLVQKADKGTVSVFLETDVLETKRTRLATFSAKPPHLRFDWDSEQREEFAKYHTFIRDLVLEIKSVEDLSCRQNLGLRRPVKVTGPVNLQSFPGNLYRYPFQWDKQARTQAPLQLDMLELEPDKDDDLAFSLAGREIQDKAAPGGVKMVGIAENKHAKHWRLDKVNVGIEMKSEQSPHEGILVGLPKDDIHAIPMKIPNPMFDPATPKKKPKEITVIPEKLPTFRLLSLSLYMRTDGLRIDVYQIEKPEPKKK